MFNFLSRILSRESEKEISQKEGVFIVRVAQCRYTLKIINEGKIVILPLHTKFGRAIRLQELIKAVIENDGTFWSK